MAEDYSELVEYLDKKFGKIDENFVNVHQKFFSTEKILGNLEEKKADKSDINNLLNVIDTYAKKADAYFQEMVMFSHQMKRHEKWIQQIADKLGIKLEY